MHEVGAEERGRCLDCSPHIGKKSSWIQSEPAKALSSGWELNKWVNGRQREKNARSNCKENGNNGGNK